ncbi:MAG: hypothetical protein M3O29_00415, partial [Actinomycetota bacterium]|nr:hypothetical protein [Actinomycetota bacterium]
MDDYRPLDLSGLCNAGLDVLDGRRPRVGEQVFHGIPFLIGDGANVEAPCFVVIEPGGASVRMPVDAHADRLIVAHRWLRPGGPELDPPPGTEIASYTVHLADGTSETVPIRERIEIAAIAEDGWDATAPFAAAGT